MPSYASILTTLLLPLLCLTLPPPTNAYPHSPLSKPLLPRGHSTCSFTDTPTIYRPGIRTGIYTHTLALWTTTYFLPSHRHIHILHNSTAIFTIAFLVVALLSIAHATTSSAIELFLVLQILSWTCLAGTRARRFSTRTRFRKWGISDLAAEIASLAAVVLHTWFWFHGIDVMQKAPCGDRAWFFTDTNLEGWFREVMKVVSVVSLVDRVCNSVKWLLYAIGSGFGSVGRHGYELRDAVRRYEEWNALSRGAISIYEHKASPSENSLEEGSLKTLIASDPTDTLTTRPTTSSETTTTPPPKAPQIPLFSDIYRGETFLTHCLNAPTPDISTTHPLLFKLLLSCGILPRPPSTLQEPTTQLPSTYPSVSYLHCIKQILPATLTLPFPRHALLLYTHLISTKSLSPITSIHQLSSALTYPSPLPPHSTILLASRAQLSQLPNPAKPNTYLKYVQACIDAVLHVFVLLQLEFTIRYNHVSGLGGLDDVGQLVPFLLGVGGLVLVLCRGGEELWTLKRGCEELEQANKEKHMQCSEGNERWIEVYEKWKAEWKAECKMDRLATV